MNSQPFRFLVAGLALVGGLCACGQASSVGVAPTTTTSAPPAITAGTRACAGASLVERPDEPSIVGGAEKSTDIRRASLTVVGTSLVFKAETVGSLNPSTYPNGWVVSFSDTHATALLEELLAGNPATSQVITPPGSGRSLLHPTTPDGSGYEIKNPSFVYNSADGLATTTESVPFSDLPGLPKTFYWRVEDSYEPSVNGARLPAAFEGYCPADSIPQGSSLAIPTVAQLQQTWARFTATN